MVVFETDAWKKDPGRPTTTTVTVPWALTPRQAASTPSQQLKGGRCYWFSFSRRGPWGWAWALTLESSPTPFAHLVLVTVLLAAPLTTSAQAVSLSWQPGTTLPVSSLCLPQKKAEILALPSTWTRSQGSILSVKFLCRYLLPRQTSVKWQPSPLPAPVLGSIDHITFCYTFNLPICPALLL